MEEDIKILEELTEDNKKYFQKPFNKDDEDIQNILKKQNKAIEHLIKSYKELEAKLNKIDKQLDLDYIDNNYIPKSLVKEKIKELENEKEQLRIEKNVTWDSQIYKISLKIDILQELLGDDK